MNREEAIKILELEKKVQVQFVDMNERIRATKVSEKYNKIDLALIEALDLAIKTLSGDMYCPSCGVRLVPENEYVEPKESEMKAGEDCINRQDAIEALDRIGSLDTEDDREYAKGIFDNIPPVTPTERTGEWEHHIDTNGIPWERCSECGDSTLSVDRENINFCPNCGAKMKGGTENE